MRKLHFIECRGASIENLRTNLYSEYRLNPVLDVKSTDKNKLRQTETIFKKDRIYLTQAYSAEHGERSMQHNLFQWWVWGNKCSHLHSERMSKLYSDKRQFLLEDISIILDKYILSVRPNFRQNFRSLF